MNLKMTVLTVACALALSACGNDSSAPTTTADAPSTAATTSTQAEAPASASAPASTAATTTATSVATPAATPATNAKPTAVVTNCSTKIEANDMMQYNVSSIVVPSSCTNFEVTLTNTGKMPVAAMGHDFVITKKSDLAAVDADGATAGLAAGYLKADDPRVIAHTKLVAGGETTSVSFPVNKIQGDGPYEFFCSFPGHSALMHGPISVE